MRRPALAFALFLAAYVAVIAMRWLPEPLTGGELAGHAAKIAALLDLLRSGDFAWFPGYLTGSPTATTLSFALAVPVYAPGLLLAADPIVGMKVTALVLLALGGIAAFAFGRRLAQDGWSGFAVGVAYLLAPQILLRAGWQEHMTILVAVPLVPLAFLAMLRVAERGSPYDAVLLGVTISAALLAWAKMGATLVLPLGVFALWLFATRPSARAHLLRGAAWAIPTTLLLGVLPLLPLLRERGFMTVFELDPFAQWQGVYSAKTATAWVDRAGDLFAVLPRPFAIDGGGYYLGLVGLLAVALTIFLTWRSAPRELAAMRLFLLLALGLFWVSFGPRNVLQGHFEFLGVARDFPDWGIPLHWLALAAPGVIIFWCLPPRRWRPVAFAVLFGIYLFVPAFRLLERLPLYADLRAPDSFWILNGTFAWSVASALSLVFVLRRLPRPRLVPLAAIAALLLATFDFSAYFRDFTEAGLDAGTRTDFRATTDQLRDGAGRVLFISGRYFSLDVPNLTGRGLSTEALNRYLMPATTARLQTASRISATDMIAYLRLSGIGDVVIEKRDPDVSSAIPAWFRAILPRRTENDGFLVFSNPLSLHPAFFGASAVPAAAGYEEYVDALRLAKTNHLTIAAPDGLPLDDLPGITTDEAASARPAADLVRVAPAAPRTAGRVPLTPPGRAGWLVLSESWHPDWTALVDGVPAVVYRAAGGFPAVPITAATRAVEFRFLPPAWYSACLGTGAISWTAALAFLALVPLIPAARRPLLADRAVPPPPAYAPADRPPVQRPLALVPTYNEAASIEALLGRLLAVDDHLAVLVIDDGSPDGTAALVRTHEAFGSRVHLLERPQKLGLGSAYRAGFRWATERGHDAALEIDADFSHDPADIPRLLAALDAGADAAVGSRYLDGVRVINWPEHRLALSVGASRYVRLLTGLPLTDATSGFKALRTAALDAVDFDQLRAEGYGFQIELHWLLWTAGCRLVEVPIVFTERRAGQTKMTLGIAVEAAARVLQLALLQPGRRA